MSGLMVEEVDDWTLDTPTYFSVLRSALVGEARLVTTGRRAGSLLLATMFATSSVELRVGCSVHCSRRGEQGSLRRRPPHHGTYATPMNR